MRREAAIFRSPAEKAKRTIEDEIAWADEHHGKVRFDGFYMAVCSCMWRGERHDSRAAAEADLSSHRPS